MDIEAPWRDIGDKLFDLIHVRQMLGSIHSWPSLYLKIFRWAILKNYKKKKNSLEDAI